MIETSRFAFYVACVCTSGMCLLRHTLNAPARAKQADGGYFSAGLASLDRAVWQQKTQVSTLADMFVHVILTKCSWQQQN